MFFFFQAEDGIRDLTVTGVQTCALPIYGERDVERMPDVVIQRVAGEVAGEAAFEQRAEVVEGARQPNEVLSGVAGGEQGEDRVADPLRILDIYAVRDVVLVYSVLHGAPPASPCRAAS